ncbi:MAG: hypothetical protein AAF221_03275 [Pseudomonadota bacterium]
MATLLVILVALPFKSADNPGDFNAFTLIANADAMAHVAQVHRGAVLEAGGVMQALGAATVLVPPGVNAADLYAAGATLVLPSNDAVACSRSRAATL